MKLFFSNGTAPLKSSRGVMLIEEQKTREVRKEYFGDKFLNNENPNEIKELECVEGPLSDKSEEELRITL